MTRPHFAIAYRAPLLFAIGLAGLAASPAYADEDVTAAANEQTIIVTGGRIVESGYRAGNSISATRTDTPLLNVPQSVTVVTVRKIQDRAANSIADAVA